MGDNAYFSDYELVVLVGAIGGIILTAMSCILKSRYDCSTSRLDFQINH